MKIITCNFRGRKHSERNEQCEDSVYFLRGTEVTTVAVADGAGSKKYEHAKDGADAVTKAVCNFFDSKFDDFFNSNNELELRSVIQTICHKALKERANELGIDSIETMASTLLAVSFKGNKAIAVQIGDGIVGKTSHGEPELITMPQNGEFASSTFFVNSTDAYKMIQVRKMFLNGTSHLFLMSDGIADCMYNDFTGAFNSSLKMILDAAEDPDGEEKIKKAIKEFIVDADPLSDDCTMAVVCFNEKSKNYETETLATETSVVSEQPVAVQENIGSEKHSLSADAQINSADTSVDVLPQIKSVEYEAEQKTEKSFAVWKIVAIIASVALIIGVAVGVVLLTRDAESNADGKTKSNRTTETTTSQTMPEVSTLSGIDSSTDRTGVVEPFEVGGQLGDAISQSSDDETNNHTNNNSIIDGTVKSDERN